MMWNHVVLVPVDEYRYCFQVYENSIPADICGKWNSSRWRGESRWLVSSSAEALLVRNMW
jgi:hypothetical protein